VLKVTILSLFFLKPPGSENCSETVLPRLAIQAGVAWPSCPPAAGLC
jgi:hypothetical protein